MKNLQDIIDCISDKSYNNAEWVELVLADSEILKIVIENINHKHIMVYFHCYEIVNNASKLNPLIFYPYWDSFVNLLNHNNLYHRIAGLSIVSNLIAVDIENKFCTILDKYLQCLQDKKFLSSVYCLKGLKRIVETNNKYTSLIENAILNYSRPAYYTDKQFGLLMSDIIGLLFAVLKYSKNKELIIELINQQQNSISPKTKKYAKLLMEKIENKYRK
jgi:hypothetical protein